MKDEGRGDFLSRGLIPDGPRIDRLAGQTSESGMRHVGVSYVGFVSDSR